jgi:hypothetical protein
MVKQPLLNQLIACSLPFLLAFAVVGCGKKEQTKAEEKKPAEKSIYSNAIAGEQVKALDKAKALEGEMNKAAAKVGEAADSVK